MFLLALSLWTSTSIFALEALQLGPSVEGPHTRIELGYESESVPRGDSLRIALRFTLEEGWHVYWKNPGDSGLPPKVQWTTPEGIRIEGPLAWPTPHRIAIPPLADYGYDSQLALPYRLQTDAHKWTDARSEIEARISWLVCKDVCVPGKATVRFTLQPGPLKIRKTCFDLIERTLSSAPNALLSPVSLEDTPDNWIFHFPELPVTDVSEIRKAEIFPNESLWFSAASLQTISEEQGTLTLSIPKGDTPPKGSLFSGLLRLELLSGQVLAFDFQADRSASFSLWTALLFAFLGGLILNLMPCVFPVLSLKIMSVVHARTERQPRLGALAYLFGIVLSLWTLWSLLLLFRTGGTELGWGFQLQSPLFIAFLTLLFFVLGLNFLGVFEFQVRLPTFMGRKLIQSEGIVGDFWNGILAVAVASPCTAPFMGAALGYALSQSLFTGWAVFTAMGIGLAFPFLVLGFAPRLLGFLPRPGAWMETFKQFLAFPMFFTAVWLLWVLDLLSGPMTVAVVLVTLIFIAMLFWFGRRRNLFSGTLPLALLLLTGLSLLGVHWLAHDSSSSARNSAKDTRWQPFSEERLKEALNSGQKVFIDFTAAWCLTCQVNKKVALETEAVRAAFDRNHILMLRADWTHPDPKISAFLARFNRSGVPLYLYYAEGANAAPTLLPEVLTPQLVIDALEPNERNTE